MGSFLLLCVKEAELSSAIKHGALYTLIGCFDVGWMFSTPEIVFLIHLHMTCRVDGRGPVALLVMQKLQLYFSFHVVSCIYDTSLM